MTFRGPSECGTSIVSTFHELVKKITSCLLSMQAGGFLHHRINTAFGFPAILLYKVLFNEISNLLLYQLGRFEIIELFEVYIFI